MAGKRRPVGPRLPKGETEYETWAKVPDAGYHVSNRGRIKRLQRTKVRKADATESVRGVKLMTPTPHRGEPYVRIFYNNGTSRYWRVKDLVADLFIPPAGKGKIVCRDGDPFNCDVTNLSRTKYRTKRITPAQIERAKELFKTEQTDTEIAESIGSTPAAVKRIRKKWENEPVVESVQMEPEPEPIVKEEPVEKKPKPKRKVWGG